MSGDIDYRAAEVPETKPPSEYTYVERRAETLELIEQAGHPRAISQTRLADRYDVSQGQISQDIDRLRSYIVATIDDTTTDAITEMVYQNAIQELMQNGEHYKAVKAVESWNDWLMDRGKVEQEPDKHEVEGSGIQINYGDD
jgi:hypothetical protein